MGNSLLSRAFLWLHYAVKNELRLIALSAPLAFGDLLITLYNSLPLVVGPSFLEPSDVIFFAFFLKISEGLQLMAAPFSRACALEYLAKSKERIRATACSYFSASLAQIWTKTWLMARLVNHRVFSLLRLSTPRFPLSLFIILLLFVVLINVVLIKLLPLSFDSNNGWIVGTASQSVSLFTLFASTASLVVVVPSVYVSTYFDIVFKAFHASFSFALLGPYCAGLAVAICGLYISSASASLNPLILAHGLSELVVGGWCFLRAKSDYSV
jgi:hypothetical protein